VEAAFGVAVRGLVAGQVPDDERLVARAREKHVGAGRRSVSCAARHMCILSTMYALLKGGSKGSNPARVALEGTTENQLLGHVCNEWLLLLLTLT
jgi:hypothetical protein